MGAIRDFFFGPSETRDDGTTTPTQTEQVIEANDALLSALLGRDSVTRQTAEQIPAVSACVDLIAGTIASMPINLYTGERGSKTEEISDDSRVFLLNNETGDTLTPTQMWRAVISDYYLGKGAFIYINKNGGKIESLNYVDERDVSYVRNTDPIFKDFNLIVQGKSYGPWQFVKFLRDTRDGIVSRPIFERNSELIDVSSKILKLQRGMMSRGGNKRGYLESEKTLGEKEFARLKAAFKRLYTTEQEDNVIVLNNGVKFREASNTAVEMQLDEMQAMLNRQIYKLFGIPVRLIEGGATKEDYDLFLHTIASVIYDLETSLDRDLLLESEKPERFFAFDTRELTRGNTKDRYAAYEIGLRNHFLQVDEVRREEDMEPIGFKWITLGLDTVLLDPDTGTVYTPNTDATTELTETGRIRKAETEEAETS